MVLRKKIKIHQSKNANTQYIVIPSSIVNDSQYPFKKEREVEIEVEPENNLIIIRSKKLKQKR